MAVAPGVVTRIVAVVGGFIVFLFVFMLLDFCFVLNSFEAVPAIKAIATAMTVLIALLP